ncbi:MAG TPA: DUF748 domain-containing protein, partial [Verrucomicrobiae bacterium]|nr:DUF748 domain-containing protein [Verrucomicrobiae bacterium]
NNFQLKSPDTGEIVLTIPSLSVTDTEANAARMNVRVGLIQSTRGYVLVRQEHNGSINLLSLLNLPAAKAGTSAKSPLPPLTAKIDEIAFDNYTIKAEDKKPEQTASFMIDQLAFNMKGVSNASNAPVTLAASFRFQENGFIGVNGSATLMPPSADLQLALTNVDLRATQPYVHEQIKLAITGGGLNLHGRARYGASETNAPLLSFAGEMAITNFDTVDDVLFKDFAKWDALTVDGINVQLRPDKFHVDQVKFSGALNTSLAVGPDRRVNLQTILREQIAAKTNAALASAKLGKAPVASSMLLPDISLGALLFQNASIHLADLSIEPHCTFDVQEFSGSIKGLSSQENSTATVAVNGKVDARSPFGITGKLNPLSKDVFADVVVTFTNTELTAFTPYMEKYAGRPLQKGKLSFAVHYLVQKNALKAENGFYVDQLTLGPKNNSPDATHLPVKLAIALLKDRNGRIALNVPVTGRIDDPQFKYGPIIWHVVVNLMEKAAASPFSLLGAMFGGGEELSYVAFEPGKATIPDAETNKLNTLIKALYARPELTMELDGSVEPEVDRPVLAQMKLEQQIKSLWVRQLTDSGKPAVALDQVQLEPKERARLIRKDYKLMIGKYQPTPPATNNLSPQQLAAAIQADMGRAFLKSTDTEHGAALLMQSAVLTKVPDLPKSSTGSVKPAKPLSRAEAELADMEAQLVKKIEVSDDDLRELMKQRAAQVQAYLLRGGKITADRLFITAPKPLGGASKGADRVNMTLD